MKDTIFREYDIRGVVGEDFSLADAEIIGQGFAAYLHQQGGRTVVVGCDCRLSSPGIKEALLKGLLGCGMHVIDIGTCSTPLLYFAVRHLNAGGGLMVTASHNPAEYNGFKVCVGPDTVYGEEIQNFKRLLRAGVSTNGRGKLEMYNILSHYSDYVVNNIVLKRPVRVAVDAGNGTGGVVAGPILKRLGCHVKELFFEMDGRFPNHEPDPTVPDNVILLKETVVREGLELGIAFDGDGDRMGVVDEKGSIIYGDMLMVIFAREILKEMPGATFIGEVKCSHRMYDDIGGRGGRPIMWKTGHSLIKQKLKEEKAVLAGEMSGHFFFAHRYFGYDDAIYATCRLLEIVAQRQEPVSRWLADLPPTYSTPEIRVPCPDEHKFELVDRVKEELAKDHDIIDVDGVRVIFPDGWGLLRASNTTPVLVLRFEAESEVRLMEFRSLVEGTLEMMKSRM